MEIIQCEEERGKNIEKKVTKPEGTVDSIKGSSIHIPGIWEGKKCEKGDEMK